MASSPLTTPKSVTRPFSIRLSEDERQALELAAGTRPLGTYIRSLILDGPPRRTRTRRPAADRVAMGRLLALMGRSRFGPGLADLAAAVRLGTVDLTPELQAQVEVACADIREVRTLLLRAMSLPSGVGP